MDKYRESGYVSDGWTGGYRMCGMDEYMNGRYGMSGCVDEWVDGYEMDGHLDAGKASTLGVDLSLVTPLCEL